MFRFSLIGIALTAIGSLAVLLGIQSQPDRRRIEPPSHAAGDVIFAAGRVEGATEEIDLRLHHRELVTEVLVVEGQTVTAGTELIRVDDRSFRHNVALAQAALDLAAAELAKLRKGARFEERKEAEARYQAKMAELRRAESDVRDFRCLYDDGAVSRLEFEQLETKQIALRELTAALRADADLVSAPPRRDEVLIAEARLAAAAAKLQQAELQLDRATLRAPCDGTVLRLHIQRGEFLDPQSSEPAVVFADAQRFRVRAFVDEFDAPKVEVGLPAVVRTDGMPGVTLSGCVSRVSPRMGVKGIATDDPAERFDTKTREVWVDLDTADLETVSQLVIGLRVDVNINTTATLLDPREAKAE